jgi:uncharacterized protein (DUF2062 family)
MKIKLKPPTWGAPRTTRSWWSSGLCFLRRLWRLAVHANDNPQRIALGVAMGLFIGWLPLVGIQTLLAAIICWIIRANFAASVPGVWLSNPLTMVPMYLLNNWVGSLFYGKRISWQEMQEIWDKIAELGIWEGTIYLCTSIWSITAPMLIGGCIIGLAVGVPGYFLSLRAALAIQRRRRERKERYRRSSENVPTTSPDDAVHP